MKPNFFIVGAPKAGTTSLYHYLEEHPEIYMSPIKETNYFSFEEIRVQGLFYNEEHVQTLAAYEEQFSKAGSAKALGEASVSYLFYPSVPGRIKQFNPEAKIIIILREPVSRGYSHYLMDKRLGFVKVPYDDVFEQKNNSEFIPLYYQQYISLGLYYEQVKRYLDAFGYSKVKIFLFEDLLADINRVMKDIYVFLDVANNFRANTLENHNTFLRPKNRFIENLYSSRQIRKVAKKIMGVNSERIKSLFMSKEKPPMLDMELRKRLMSFYKPDILKTQELINRDLSTWLR